MAVRVADDGTPGLSDTKRFTIVVSSAPALRIVSVERLANGQVELRWSADPAALFEVVFKDHLSDPSWSSLGPASSVEGSASFSDSTATAPQRYYQIKQLK